MGWNKEKQQVILNDYNTYIVQNIKKAKAEYISWVTERIEHDLNPR